MSVTARPEVLRSGVARLDDCMAVLFTRSRWHEPPRIRHQVARQLARFCPVVFAETPASGRGRGDAVLEEVSDNLFRCPIGMPFPIPLRFVPHVPGLHRALQRHVLRATMEAIRPLPKRPLVIVDFDYDFPLATAFEPAVLTAYVCNDDFVTMADGRLRRALVLRQERRTAAGADICFAVSHSLVGHIERFNANTHLLLPGHDVAVTAPQVRTTRGPIRVAFMGFINSRLDFAWLATAAAEPDIALELIGPIESMPPAMTELISKGVVRHLGTLTGLSLQRALADNDVLLMPYDSVAAPGVHAGTVSNKLFTYLAVAKPVVISDLPNFIDLGQGIIYRASSAADFVETIRRAHQEDSDDLRAARQRIARENSWEIRGDLMKAQLDAALRVGRKGRRA